MVVVSRLTSRSFACVIGMRLSRYNHRLEMHLANPTRTTFGYDVVCKAVGVVKLGSKVFIDSASRLFL